MIIWFEYSLWERGREGFPNHPANNNIKYEFLAFPQKPAVVIFTHNGHTESWAGNSYHSSKRSWPASQPRSIKYRRRQWICLSCGPCPVWMDLFYCLQTQFNGRRREMGGWREGQFTDDMNLCLPRRILWRIVFASSSFSTRSSFGGNYVLHMWIRRRLHFMPIDALGLEGRTIK